MDSKQQAVDKGTGTRSPNTAPAGRSIVDIPHLDFFRQCFQEFPDPVLIVDNEREIVFMNDAAEELLCYSIDPEGVYPSCSELIRVVTDEGERCFLEQCLQQKENLHRVSVRLRTPEGTVLLLSATASILRDDSGEVVGCLAIFRDIRADLLAQPEIEAQITTLSSILRHFPVPFFMVDPNLNITYMNKHLEMLTGYKQEEAVGRMTCAQLLCTGYCETEHCLLRQSMKDLLPISGIRRTVKNRFGREIPVVVYSSIITDHNGQVTGGFEALRDITPVIEAENKITLLAEMSMEGILMADKDRHIIFANSQTAEIFGVPKDTLIGRQIGEVLPSELDEMALNLIQNVDQECYCQRSHLRLIQLPVGSEKEEQRTYESSMAVLRIGQGIVTYIYLRDMTERIEIENQLRRAYSFVSNIIQNSVNGVIVTNNEQSIVIFNKEAERILGYKAEEIIGQPQAFQSILPPHLCTELSRRMPDSAYGPPGKANLFRTSLLNKEGQEVPVNFSIASIMEEDRETGAVAIFSDLRDQLRMQSELEQARLQVLQADRIASLGRLAAGVAHEINNPLAGILIYADMLLKESGLHAAWRQDVEEIITQTLRCKEIVTRLLEFSRQALTQKILFDVNEIIIQSTQLFKHQVLFQDIEIIQNLDAGLPLILGDPGQIRQVFTNLIINAADAMDGRGTLTITSRFDPDRDQVVLKFTDTGGGICAGDIDKVFEPFFTTKPPGKGTGLGLSISYGVVQRHGGSLSVESSPGSGTTFTVVLPIESAEEESTMIPAAGCTSDQDWE